MAKTVPDTPNLRPLRVGEELRHVLAEVFARGLKDPELDGLILSVSEVRLTPDLKTATVFVRALAHADGAGVVKALARNAKPLRGEIARRARLRAVPELRFRWDETLDAAASIDALLRKPEIARDLKGEERKA